MRLMLPAKTRIQLDYLHHWNPWLDIRIIFQTLARVWSPRARENSRQIVRSVLAGEGVDP
jgi:lipopolysaccharide/colanic/teichoic acid biosynthesis glycosyltransferase